MSRPWLRPRHDAGEADGVDVEDRGGIGVGSHLGRIAGEAEDIFEAHGRGAEEVALDAEEVAVAAGVVEDGFDADALLDLDAERSCCRHAGAGARASPGTLMASTPSLWSSMAPSISLVVSKPLGGTISTMVQKVLEAMRAPDL